MKSLFEEPNLREMLERINKLNKDTKPEWGSMNVSQMLVHYTVTLKLAFGEIIPERNEKNLEFGKMVKDRVLKTEVFGKNSPTSKEFLDNSDYDFEESKTELINYLKRFVKCDIESTKTQMHPYFGELPVKEWDMFIWKHLNHHLIQFGV